jgi:hypothetical protein
VTYLPVGRRSPSARAEDIAGVGDTTAQSWNLVGDPAIDNPQFSRAGTWTRTSGSTRGLRASGGGHVRHRGRNPRASLAGFQSWDIALFKNIPLGGTKRLQLRFEAFNFINHPNLGNAVEGGPGTGSAPATIGGVVVDPNNADFGRVLTKTNERNVQLGVKFSF